MALTPAVSSDQIRAGILLVEHPTPNRVGLMAVHAAEDHLVAIDAEDITIISMRRKPSRMLSVSPADLTWAS